MKTLTTSCTLVGALLVSSSALAQQGPPGGTWSGNVDVKVVTPSASASAPTPAPPPPATSAPAAPTPPLPQPAPAPVQRLTIPDTVEPDRPATPPTPVANERLLHGFRIGYSYVANIDRPVKSLGNQSLSDKIGIRSPHSMLLGYELFYRMTGQGWLNVILVGNVMVAGLEQSQFYPTANTLLGFEINNSFQIGVGANLAPLKDSAAHAIFAAGWTPRAGTFYVPVHAFFVPDVDGVNRMGVTTGVTW